MARCRLGERIVALIRVKRSIFLVVPVTREEPRDPFQQIGLGVIVFVILIVGTVVRGNTIRKFEGAVAKAYFVGELLVAVARLDLGGIATEFGHNIAADIRYVLNVDPDDQQHCEYADDHEHHHGEGLGQPPGERRADDIPDQASGMLHRLDVESVGLRGELHVENRTHDPEQHRQPDNHAWIARSAPGMAHQPNRNGEEEHREDNTH